MANLPESSTFDAGVYQLELTDPVIGGPSGVSNTPLKNLANRTKYLKDHVDALEATRAPIESPTFTGSPKAPTAVAGANNTQLANTEFVKAAIAASLATFATAIVGEIRMFDAGTTLPAGWRVCNGLNGTPDLRDKFIMASGTRFSTGASGGSFSIGLNNMPSHNHGGTVSGNTGTESQGHTHLVSGDTWGAGAHNHTINDPGHSHSTTYDYASNKAGAYDANVSGTPTNWFQNGTTANTTGISVNGVGDHAHHLEINSGGQSQNHTHAFSAGIAAQGGGQDFVQPYYALIFAKYVGV